MVMWNGSEALVAAVLVMGPVVGVTALGPAVAHQHTYEAAADYTGEANFTVALPYTTDHYPGDENEANGSIEYWASGEQAFYDLDAEEGAYIHYIIIRADWIDYSECSTTDTAAFGIDRGNNNTGTRTDEPLLDRRKNDYIMEHGITVVFYEWDDFAGDPPYMAPEDAIVAAQGKGEGPCLTVTSEPGWYQVQGFLNATEADNGVGQEPSEDATESGVMARSNYLYVCECDSEQDARDRLGVPPDERDGTDRTPTVDTAVRDTPTVDTAVRDTPPPTRSETTTGPGGTATPTPTRASAVPATAATPTESIATATNAEDALGTPTMDEGPGFGSVLAVLALLAGAGIVRRR